MKVSQFLILKLALKPQAKQHGTSVKTDLWNRMESPEINPHVHGQMTFNKHAKTIQWAKDSLLNKRYWENWIPTYKKKKKMKLDFYLMLCTKINSKWTYDLK